MPAVYHHPAYYELAFSFRDIPAEVDVFETLIGRHSRIPVRRLLELGCGPAPHLPELSRRGYSYVGLDLSRPMLDHAQRKAAPFGASATFVEASMLDFHLAEPVEQTVEECLTLDVV